MANPDRQTRNEAIMPTGRSEAEADADVDALPAGPAAVRE